MKINPLTTAEENLMHILWKLDTAYMKDIMQQLPEPKPHQNTVSTFLKILVEKNFLTTEKEGRIFRYHVNFPFDEYRKTALKNLLSNYFNDSGSELLKVLKEENLIAENPVPTMEAAPQNVEPPKATQSAISEYLEELTSGKKKKKPEKKKKEKKRK